MQNNEEVYSSSEAEDSLVKINEYSSSSETESSPSINIAPNIEIDALIEDEGSLSISAIGFYRLTENRVDEAIDILIQKLLRTSDLSVHGIFDDESEVMKEVEEFYRNIFADGFSVVAVDESNGKVIAVAFIKIRLSKYISEEDFYMRFHENCQNEWLKRFVNSLIKLETIADLFYSFDLPYYLQVVATAVLLQYEKSDLSCLLIKAAVDLSSRTTSEQQTKIKMQISTSVPFEEIIYMPPLIAFMAANEYSKDFLTKLDFMEISSVPYEYLDINISHIPDTLKEKYKNVCFMMHWKRTANQTFPGPFLSYL